MNVATLGIDLAKSVFRLHGVDTRGVVVLRRQVTRKQLLPLLARLSPCLIGLEACASGHYWAREINKLGHTVKLMSPHFVAPYRKSQKNDGNDAEAVCEAVGCPSMRFVPLKATAQQDVQALHRIRAQLIKWRTRLANEIRGLLGEYGIALRKGMAPLRHALASIVEDERQLLSPFFREMVSEMREQLRFLGERLQEYDRRVQSVFSQDERCQRLAKVEGVGVLAVTALVAAVGNAREFRTGRELSAWLGLVPHQHSTGGRAVLLGITKRGDRYLRMLLIHGARAALRWVERRRDAPGVALTRLKARRGPNIAAVALANRNARVLWALLTGGEDYRPRGGRLAYAQAT